MATPGWSLVGGVALAALTLPFLVVVAIARLDLLRGGHPRGVDLFIGGLMLAVLAAGYWVRRWAWRVSESPVRLL